MSKQENNQIDHLNINKSEMIKLQNKYLNELKNSQINILEAKQYLDENRNVNPNLKPIDSYISFFKLQNADLTNQLKPGLKSLQEMILNLQNYKKDNLVEVDYLKKIENQVYDIKNAIQNAIQQEKIITNNETKKILEIINNTISISKKFIDISKNINNIEILEEIEKIKKDIEQHTKKAVKELETFDEMYFFKIKSQSTQTEANIEKEKREIADKFLTKLNSLKKELTNIKLSSSIEKNLDEFFKEKEKLLKDNRDTKGESKGLLGNLLIYILQSIGFLKDDSQKNREQQENNIKKIEEKADIILENIKKIFLQKSINNKELQEQNNKLQEQNKELEITEEQNNKIIKNEDNDTAMEGDQISNLDISTNYSINSSLENDLLSRNSSSENDLLSDIATTNNVSLTSIKKPNTSKELKKISFASRVRSSSQDSDFENKAKSKLSIKGEKEPILYKIILDNKNKDNKKVSFASRVRSSSQDSDFENKEKSELSTKRKKESIISKIMHNKKMKNKKISHKEKIIESKNKIIQSEDKNL
ncbi:MAG: hypothetical protein U1E31_00950 [Rickettsiales bacterium]